MIFGVVLATVAPLLTIALLNTAGPTFTKLGSPAAPRPPSAPTPTAQQTVGPVEVSDDVQRGLVLIAGISGNESVSGTGMVLTPDGYVLTNYHVVRSTSQILTLVSATGRKYPATLIGRDATKDVALLKMLDAQDLPVVTLDQDTVKVGDTVVAAGNANGQGFVTANRGNVQAMDTSISVRSASKEDPPVRLQGLIETNAPAWPGDSGGPMFDDQGEVLGMTTAGGDPDEAETDDADLVPDRQVYAVPIADAMAVVNQIRSGHETGTVVIGPKAYLGVVVRPDNTTRGARVTRVEQRTPASRTGLKDGDTITFLNDTVIENRSDLSTVLDKIEPGASVPIEWTTVTGQERSSYVRVEASVIN